MKHFRPIKTFATWLLDTVEVYITPKKETLRDNPADKWIRENLNLTKLSGSQKQLDLDIYLHSYSGFPIEGNPCKNNFYFPDAESANLFYAQFGGERKLLDVKDNPRKNEPIAGNFTLDDLVYLYGNPLPNVIQYHLVDMEDRLSGYFNRYNFMHQHWAHRAHWIPSAFVYVDERAEGVDTPNQWLYQNLHKDSDPKHTWQHGWESSVKGIYEFDDPSLAAMFKLALGGAPIPSRLGIGIESVFDKLSGPVSGISRREGRFGIWEKQANIPDYRNPRVMD
jgi:hypothetical protein